MSDRLLRHAIVIAAASLLLSLPAESGELVDPTRPSHARAQTQTRVARAPAWRVETIIVSPTRRLALINGRMVGIGDRVSGAKVIEILPYEVQLEYQGETRRISLVATQVKNPAK